MEDMAPGGSRAASVEDVHDLAIAMPHVTRVEGPTGNPIYAIGRAGGQHVGCALVTLGLACWPRFLARGIRWPGYFPYISMRH